jgi:hypothetical protein
MSEQLVKNDSSAADKRFLRRIPTPILALLLVLPFVVCDVVTFSVHYRALRAAGMAAFFAVGGIQRLRWRQMLLMAAAGLAWYGIAFWLTSTYGWPFMLQMVMAAIPVLLVGMAEGLFCRQLNLRFLAWLGAAVLAATGTILVLGIFLACTDWRLRILHNDFLLDLVAYAPLRAMVTWSAVCLALACPGWSRKGRVWTGAGLAATCGLGVVFFTVLLVPLSRLSIRGYGPFSRANAARVLYQRGSANDRKEILQLVQSEWQNDKSQSWGDIEFRFTALGLFARHGNEEDAQIVSALLLKHHSNSLASESVELLARFNRQECVPLLMRYALFGERGFPGAGCIGGLERMKVPQAALAILAQRERMPATWDDYDENKNRQRLAKLLGDDPGPDPKQWPDWVESKLPQTPSPLPEPVQVELDRVIACWEQYQGFRDQYHRAVGQLAVTFLNDSGHDVSLDDLVAYLKHPWLDPRNPFVPSSIYALDKEGVLYDCVYRAERSLKESLPDQELRDVDLDVPTTADLEAEVSAYGQRVQVLLTATPTSQEMSRKGETTRPCHALPHKTGKGMAPICLSVGDRPPADFSHPTTPRLTDSAINRSTDVPISATVLPILPRFPRPGL